jgi:nicotinamidase-related amidase
MADLELFPESAGLAIVDVQERLAAAMPDDDMRVVLRNAHTLVQAARRLGLPVALSEQYPQGLGAALPVLAEELDRFPQERLERFAKQEFSCAAVPGWMRFVEVTGRRQWIVVGMEAHVCVYQTVRALCERGFSVHVPRDAVVSRKTANRDAGLALMERAGAIVTSTETVVFDLLKQAGTDEFKKIAQLLK